jgi:hypothetical protein
MRHQGYLFGLAVLMLVCSVIALMMEPVYEPFFALDRGSLTIFTIIVGTTLIDAFFAFHRRKKMAVLVGDYLGMKGGRRKNDSLETPHGEDDPETLVTKINKTESVTGSNLSTPLVTDTHTTIETSIEKNHHEPSISQAGTNAP